ncbi:glycosyltransferase [Vibrio sp. CUB2]|uniref:glycosyltransferase n=1 Tax=Vibrio sp. CUB2 TaxID=2315233 RepID=UPI00076AD923|nr:glycosyltransferase [Vibrio sp. CUB2]
MKILFVLETFELGGVERVTYQLLKGLQDIYQCIELHVVYESDLGDLRKAYTSSFDCYHMDGRNYWEKKARFKVLLDKVSPNIVVYTKGGLSKYKPFSKSYNSISHVAIQHVPIDLPETNKFKNLIRRFGAAFLYRRMDRVVCVSKGIAQNLVERIYLSKNKLETIYNPVVDDEIRELSNENLDYSDYYICVGRIHYQKGYDYLIDIVPKIIESVPDVKILILGDGERKTELQERIEQRGLSSNIILLGSVKNPYPYIKNAKAILLPSRWEGLPTVLVEAAFLGTQIVAFNCRYGPFELTSNGKYGYLVDTGDVNRFSDCIISLEGNYTLPSADVTEFTLPYSCHRYNTLFEKLLCKTN